MDEPTYDDLVAACPTSAYHETHRYCPSCPWTEVGPMKEPTDQRRCYVEPYQQILNWDADKPNQRFHYRILDEDSNVVAESVAHTTAEQRDGAIDQLLAASLCLFVADGGHGDPGKAAYDQAISDGLSDVEARGEADRAVAGEESGS